MGPLVTVLEMEKMPEIQSAIKSAEANYNVTCGKINAGIQSLLVFVAIQLSNVKCSANSDEGVNLKVKIKFVQGIAAKKPRLSYIKYKFKK